MGGRDRTPDAVDWWHNLKFGGRPGTGEFRAYPSASAAARYVGGIDLGGEKWARGLEMPTWLNRIEPAGV